MPFLTLRNYESKQFMLLNTNAIISVRVKTEESPISPNRLYLAIEQTNRPDPGLYFPIDEKGIEDWKQTDPERALANVRAVLAAL